MHWLHVPCCIYCTWSKRCKLKAVYITIAAALRVTHSCLGSARDTYLYYCCNRYLNMGKCIEPCLYVASEIKYSIWKYGSCIDTLHIPNPMFVCVCGGGTIYTTCFISSVQGRTDTTSLDAQSMRVLHVWWNEGGHIAGSWGEAAGMEQTGIRGLTAGRGHA